MVFLARPMATACLTMALLMAVSNGQLFTDERAGYHIDNTLMPRGIQILLSWRAQFLDSVAIINSTLDWVEEHLDTHYTDDVMFNLTQYLISNTGGIDNKLDTATAMAANLNISDDGDGLVAFFKTPDTTVNVQGAYNPGNRAGGTFTAPQYGLYHITVRSTTGYPVSIDLIRNGNETLASVASSNFYDIQTRISLKWLNAGDEIFTTGTEPMYFGVLLLQVQELLPSSL